MNKVAPILFVFLMLSPSVFAGPAQDDCKRGHEAYYAAKYAQALEYLDRAIKQKPDYAEAYEYRSSVHQTTSQIQPAIDDLSAAIKYAPEKEYLRSSRAQLYLRTNRALDAIVDLDWCVAHRKNPNVQVQDLYILIPGTINRRLWKHSP